MRLEGAISARRLVQQGQTTITAGGSGSGRHASGMLRQYTDKDVKSQLKFHGFKPAGKNLFVHPKTGETVHNTDSHWIHHDGQGNLIKEKKAGLG